MRDHKYNVGQKTVEANSGVQHKCGINPKQNIIIR